MTALIKKGLDVPDVGNAWENRRQENVNWQSAAVTKAIKLVRLVTAKRPVLRGGDDKASPSI